MLEDNADDLDTGDDGDDVASALTNTFGTDVDAKKAAASALTAALKENKSLSSDEQDALNKYTSSAEEARTALKQAQANLLANRRSRQEQALSQAAMMSVPPGGRPTGTIGETFSNIARARAAQLAAGRDEQSKIDELMLKYGLQGSQLGQQEALQRLAIAKSHMAPNYQMMLKAMTALAKPTRNANAQLSSIGKTVQDMGLTPGTPEFAAEVKRQQDILNAARKAQAGIDAPAANPDVVKLRAFKFGVPIPDVDPFQGLGTKQKQVEAQKLSMGADAYINKLKQDQNLEDSYIQAATEFLQLNEKTHSGQIAGRLPAMGPDAQTMDKLAFDMSRTLRLPGERVTNYDMQLFGKASMSRTKDYQANKNLATAGIMNKQNQKDYRSFLEAFRAVHGHLVGADNYWDQYLKDNPIFQHIENNENRKEPILKLNPNRVPYQTYFRKMLADKEDKSNEPPSLQGKEVDLPRPGASTATPGGYAKGGRVYKHRLAELVRKSGRKNDTNLVHMSDGELDLLRRQWGEPDTNPHTGLPEYSWLSSAIDSVKDVVHKVDPVANATDKALSYGYDKLKNFSDFEKSKMSDVVNQLKSHPQRILYGSFDPLSTKMWNKIWGTNYDPVINQLGGPTEQNYQNANKRGVSGISSTRTMHDVIGAIAGAIGGSSLGSLVSGAGSAGGSGASALTDAGTTASSGLGEAAGSGLGEAAGSGAGTLLPSVATLAPTVVSGSSGALGSGIGAGLGAAAGAGGIAGVDTPPNVDPGQQPTFHADNEPPSTYDKLTQWIKDNPLKAAQLGYTAYKMIGGSGNSSQPGAPAGSPGYHLDPSQYSAGYMNPDAVDYYHYGFGPEHQWFVSNSALPPGGSNTVGGVQGVQLPSPTETLTGYYKAPTITGLAKGGRVSAIKRLSRIMEGQKPTDRDIDDLIYGLNPVSGVPGSQRERLHQLALNLSDARASGADTGALNDQILNHLSEIYFNPDVSVGHSNVPIESIASPRTQPVVPDLLRQPSQAIPMVNTGHGTLPSIDWGKLLQKYRGGRVKYAKGGAVKKLKTLGTALAVPTAGGIAASALTGEDTDVGDYPGGMLAAEQGATMGFGDEINAALRSATTQKDYKDALALERAKLEKFRERSPYAAFTSEVAGSIPAVLTGGAGASSLTSRFAPKVISDAVSNPLVSSILGGAAYGGVSGFGAGDEEHGRLPSAAEGATLGALLGPFGHLVAKYGVRGAQNLYRRTLSDVKPMTPAQSAISGAFEESGVKPLDVASELSAAQKSGVPAIAADVGGPEVQALAAAVAGRKSDASRDLADLAARRQAGSRSRVAEQVNRGLKPDPYYEQMDKLTDNLYTNAKPLYEQAYAEGTTIPVSDISGYLLNNKFGKSAFKNALQLMKAEGIDIGKQGLQGQVSKVNVQSLDYTKRVLDDMIRKEETDGPTNTGRVLRNMREKLVNQIDDASPTYAAARQQYAGDLEVRNALKMGREDFPKMDAEQVARTLKPMSWAEKDAMRTGVAAHLYDVINGPSTDINAAQKIVGSPEMVEKLRPLFETPASFKVFLAALNRESQMVGTNKAITQAAARGRAARAGVTDRDAIQDIMSSVHPYGGVHGGGAWGGLSAGPLIGKVVHWLSTKPTLSEDAANEVAQTLSSGSPKEVASLMQELDKRATKTQAEKKVASAVGKTIGNAAATGVTTSSLTPSVTTDEGE